MQNSFGDPESSQGPVLPPGSHRYPSCFSDSGLCLFFRWNSLLLNGLCVVKVYGPGRMPWGIRRGTPRVPPGYPKGTPRGYLQFPPGVCAICSLSSVGSSGDGQQVGNPSGALAVPRQHVSSAQTRPRIDPESILNPPRIKPESSRPTILDTPQDTPQDIPQDAPQETPLGPPRITPRISPQDTPRV